MWAEYAKEDGADGVLLLPPTLYRSTDDGIVEHFRKVAEVGLPIMAYNNPFDTKVDHPQLGARLAEIPEVVAIKEFSGDVRRVFEIKEALRHRRHRGADDVLFEMLVDGAVGWFAATPTLPGKRSSYDLCVSGKLESARAVRTPWRCNSARVRGSPGCRAPRAHPAPGARPGHRGHPTRIGRPGSALIPPQSRRFVTCVRR